MRSTVTTTYLFVFIAVLSFLLLPAAAGVIDIHMAVTGNDATGAGTAQSPFASLQRCIAAAGPGDTIYIHEGTYTNEPASGGYRIFGEPDAWIVIRGVPGEDKPVFASNEIMSITSSTDYTQDSRYFKLKDVEFDLVDPIAHCMYINDGGLGPGHVGKVVPCHDFIIEGCVFNSVNLHCEGIKMTGCDNFIIRDCLFDMQGAINIGVAGVGCHFGEISNCVIRDAMQGGIQFKGGSSDIVIRNNLIERCYFIGVDIGGDTWWEYCRPDTVNMEDPKYEAKNIYVYSNFIVDCALSIGLNTCSYSKVFNNFIYRTTNAPTDGGGFYPNRGMIWIQHRSAWCPTPSHHCEISNNLFYFTVREAYWENIIWRTIIGDEALYSDTFEIYNNLWYCYDAPDQSYASFDDDGEVVPPPVFSGNIFAEDPLLWMDPANNILRPNVDGPVKWAGRYVAPPTGVEYILDYLDQRFASPPSIGAIEVDAENEAPPAPPVTPSIQPR